MNDFDINDNNALDNSADNPVLEKIVSELSSLRNEMASIKAELDMLKKTDSVQAAADDISLPNTEAEESTGFFSGDEDDETIALSGDELNNILNSADFTEETAEPETSNETVESPVVPTESFEENIEEPEVPAEMPETSDDSSEDLTYENGEGPDTSIDFNENVSEPVIDDINFDVENDDNQAPDVLPDEIDIPSNDDSFVVDASSTDFLEDKDPTLDEALSSDKVSYLNEDALDNVTVDEGTSEPQSSGFVPITQDELTSAFESGIVVTNDTPDAAEAPVEEEQEEEVDITPTESVFESEQWEPEPASETTEATDDIPAVEEPAFAENQEPVSADVSSMSESLKNDVKSVLSYMDQLLENLPEEKIAEFAKSEHFEVYKKLFTELGLA